MHDKTAVKTLLKPAPPASSPNANGNYISPKTTKILNNNINNNTVNRTPKYLNSKSSSNSSNNISSNTNITSSVASLIKKIGKENSSECLFEIQGLEPSPGTTYHQIVVYAPLDNPRSKAQKARKNGAVVLREWPRMRYSQKYSRDAGPNPAEVSFPYEEFLELVEENFLLKETSKEQSMPDSKKDNGVEVSPKKSDQQKIDWVQSNQTYSSNLRDKIIHIFGEQKFREIVNCVVDGIEINNERYFNESDD